MTNTTNCRGCGQPMVWIKSPKGRPIPCDPAVITVVTDAGEVVKGRVSHFATCPKAKDFSRSKGGRHA